MSGLRLDNSGAPTVFVPFLPQPPVVMVVEEFYIHRIYSDDLNSLFPSIPASLQFDTHRITALCAKSYFVRSLG